MHILDNIISRCYKQYMLNATLIKRVDLTKDLIFVHIKPDAGVPDFHPGQYVALGLPDKNSGSEKIKLVKRAYSIGSPSHEKNHLEFYIAIVENGEFTPILSNLKEGDRLHVAPKITGTFTLKHAPETARLIFVSTGTGIAPFMAMLRTPTTWENGRKVVIIHGVRYQTDLAYADEIRALIAEGKDLEYHSIVSRADENWTGHRGYVQKLFKEGVVKVDPLNDHIFICGNPAMIEDLQKILEAGGSKENTKKSPGNLHLEKYW
jgi:ferredoxin--NADP+ reductase